MVRRMKHTYPRAIALAAGGPRGPALGRHPPLPPRGGGEGLRRRRPPRGAEGGRRALSPRARPGRAGARGISKAPQSPLEGREPPHSSFAPRARRSRGRGPARPRVPASLLGRALQPLARDEVAVRDRTARRRCRGGRSRGPGGRCAGAPPRRAAPRASWAASARASASSMAAAQRERVGGLAQEAEDLGLVDGGHRGRELLDRRHRDARHERVEAARLDEQVQAALLGEDELAHEHVHPLGAQDGERLLGLGRAQDAVSREAAGAASAASAVAGSESTTSTVRTRSLTGPPPSPAPPSSSSASSSTAAHLGGAAEAVVRPLREGLRHAARRGGRAGGRAGS